MLSLTLQVWFLWKLRETRITLVRLHCGRLVEGQSARRPSGRWPGSSTTANAGTQINPTYQVSEDSDSHHYIEPMEWTAGPALDSHGYPLSEPSFNEDGSANLRHRPQQMSRSTEKMTNIRDELPSRNFDGHLGHLDNESDDGDTTVRRHNSNLTIHRFRSAVVRHMDHNALFDLLNSDPEATSEQVRETLRSVNQSLTLKRQVKARLSKAEEEAARRRHKAVSFSKRVKYHLAMNWQHLQQELWTLHQNLDLWHSHLKAVQGHFGSGVASYFYFLRRLFFLNLLACVLIVSFVVVPQAIFDNSHVSDSNVPFGGSELLTGDGSFKDTLLYYGHYTNQTITGYKIPEAYLFTYTAYIICCIFILTFSVAKTYRVNYIETAGELKNIFAPKLLAAWDYTIERESSARLKSKSIYSELNELIAGQVEQNIQLTLGKRLLIYFWRVVINLLILCGMVATGYLVNQLLTKSAIQVDMPVLKEITVALVITSILFVVPFIFSVMSKWEYYTSKQTQIYLNIVRVVILRTVILGVVVAFWLTESSQKKDQQSTIFRNSTTPATATTTTTTTASTTHESICWETRLGQEMYRLIMVDFLCVLLLPTFVLEFLRCLCYNHCSKWVGFPEFDIAQNTLDLVYTQMLVWVGFFYSPLLPLVTVIKLFLIFYVKRLSVIQNCQPPLKAWRAAHAQTLFLTLTFGCFMLSLLALGYSILTISPSKTCGPFRDLVTVYNIVLDLIDTSENSTKALNKLLSPGVVAGVLLFLCVIVYYKRATAKAHMDMVKLLREQLILEGKDKVFLLRLFENAMEQQQICAYMKRNVQAANNAISRENSEPVMNNLARPDVNDSPFSGTNFVLPNVVPAERRERPISDEMTRRGRLGELQREENYGSRSTSRESSPFYAKSSPSEGHRINARDSPPYLQPHDGSPYSGPSRRRGSESPYDSMDRRGSQASQRASQVPLFMKPTHQHGFRQLTPAPQGSSRQSTPQRF